MEYRLCLSGVPAIASVDLQNDTGEPGDNITLDPRLSGSVSSERDVSLVDIEIDLSGNGIADDSAFADANGNFTYDPTGSIGYGQVTIYMRPGELDDDTGNYFFGEWTSITFTYEAVDPPEVSSVSLQNDTGEPGDNITLDPRLSGTVTSERTVSLVDIEIDLSGNGIADDSAFADANGNFTYDPTGSIGYGQVTIYFRPGELDDNTGDYFFGEWVSITFTYEAVDPPEVASVSLQNDTGDPGDNITKDPRLTGSVTSERDVSLVDIEIDLNGNGIADTSAFADANGNFTYDPTGSIGYGQVTIYMRAGELDDNTGDYFFGDWVSITFTYEAPDPPEITSVSLQNDTGDPGDNITEDPTLTGSVTSENPVSLVEIEIDFSGNGIADDYAYVDANGTFTYDPSGYIGSGEVTIYLRAKELDDNTGLYIYGDWISITFTYEEYEQSE